MKVQAVLFDKDGTLFNFQASWGAWSADLVADLAGGDADLCRRLADAIGYDPANGRFAADSPVISGTPDEIAAPLLAHLPHMSSAGMVARMNSLAATAVMTEAVPLVPLLASLRARGLRLGVATNDGEAPARAQLASAGIEAEFDFIAGFDSGHGGKPDPAMLLAFAAGQGLLPGEVVMVGDSLHDLMAGRSAGMATVAVLTGLADEQVLSPHADAVLPDIGHLPAWLDGRSAVEGAEPQKNDLIRSGTESHLGCRSCHLIGKGSGAGSRSCRKMQRARSGRAGGREIVDGRVLRR